MTATMNSAVYGEDEAPLPVPVQASRSAVLEQNTYCEYPAVANGADHDGFAVMVHVKAPALVTAATLDLVAVLDVSESMAADGNLAQVKRAMAFVVDRLGPRDRLSVVAFSGDTARQVVPLMRMTDDGKAAAKLAVAALEASSSSTPAAPTTTNVRAGLDGAEKVLRGRRRHWNDVSSVILISDDGHGRCDDDDNVPEFFRTSSGSGDTPVHTFALGSDHLDAAAMHGISAATGGTFSFVEDHAVIQDAVARCVAGLLSVTARDAWLEISFAPCPITEDYFNVTAAKSGRYKARIAPACDEANVDVGDLYADEERRILLFMDIPRLDDADYGITRLVNVHCYYTDVATGQEVELADGDSYNEIERPVETTMPDMAARCVEVERELLRVAAAEDMALAREAAERGAYAEAARILDARRELLGRSAPALSGDAVCAAVAAELRELSRRVADEREYRKTGRACILASMTSHGLQRGSSSVRFGCGVGSSVFATPAMRKMEKLSEMLRKQQEAPPRPPLPKNGSNSGVTLGSRRRLEARLASAVPSLSLSKLSRYRRLLLKR